MIIGYPPNIASFSYTRSCNHPEKRGCSSSPGEICCSTSVGEVSILKIVIEETLIWKYNSFPCSNNNLCWINLFRKPRRLNLASRDLSIYRKNFWNEFGGWSWVYSSRIPSLVELGGLGGLPQLFKCILSVLGWWQPYAALWILGPHSLKSPYLGMGAMFLVSKVQLVLCI